MSYTVIELITDAFYETRIVGRSFETPTGEQYNDGLKYFNQVLGRMFIDDGALPYYIQYNFNFVIGQQTYFIPNLTEVETGVFFLDNVRYSLASMKRKQYWGSPRVENIQTLPVYYTVDRVLGGSNFSVYFFPDQNYNVQIWAQFALQNATLNQDLTQYYDQYYIDYLRYCLGIVLCGIYGVPVPEGIRELQSQYDKAIRKRSGYLDVQQIVMSTVDVSTNLNYGQVNIGRGYTAYARAY